MLWIKRFFFWGIILLLLFAVASLLIEALYSEQLSRLLLQQFNAALRVKAEARGDSDMSLLKDFPRVSFVYNDVVLPDAFAADVYLLKAEELRFVFDISSLLSESYEVNTLVFSEGFLHIRSDAKGNYNFDIFKENKTPSSSSKNLQLNEILLENMELEYKNADASVLMQAMVQQGNIKGSYNDKNARFNMQVQGIVQQYYADSLHYFSKIPLQCNSDIAIDWQKNHYDFQNTQIALGDLEFDIKGNISSKTASNVLDLRIKADQLPVEKLAILLPQEYAAYADSVELEAGTAACTINIRGNWSETEMPRLVAQMTTKNAGLMLKKWELPLDNIAADFTFDNKASLTADRYEINIRPLRFTADKQEMTMEMQYKNFDNPQMEGILHGSCALSLLRIFRDRFPHIDAQGAAALNRFSWAWTAENGWHRLSGTMQIQQGVIENKALKIENLQGLLCFEDRNIKIMELSGKAFGGDITLQSNIGMLPDSTWRTQNHIIMQNADLETLFTQCENFGMEVLKAENIKGTLQLNMLLRANLLPDNTLDKETLWATADIAVERGELVNFQPMLTLAKYARIDELQRVQFNTLSNHFEIENRMLHFYPMNIESNIFNIDFSGKHTFQNYLMYNIRVDALNTLAKKIKSNKINYNETPELNTRGGFILYYSLRGDMSNPSILSGKKGLIENNFEKDKKGYKYILTKELEAAEKLNIWHCETSTQ